MLIVRLATYIPEIGLTITLNRIVYASTPRLRHSIDGTIVPYTHFRLLTIMAATEAGQSVTCQLARFASPTIPLSAAGDDLTVTSAAGLKDSGWIALATPLAASEDLQVALKGSNGTVDLSGLWFDVQYRLA